MCHLMFPIGALVSKCLQAVVNRASIFAELAVLDQALELSGVVALQA